MQAMLEFFSEHWKEILLGLSVTVEIAPIKINPWSALLKWIGRIINDDVVTRLQRLEERADAQRKSIDENEMDRIRWEVLDFANACRNHVRHTKDEFQHIISLNTKYHHLLEKYEQKNGVFDAEYEYILELYKELQHNNEFL